MGTFGRRLFICPCFGARIFRLLADVMMGKFLVRKRELNEC